MAYRHLEGPLVPLQDHIEQTLAQRKKQHKTDVVAPTLAKFQSIKYWPRSGKPLPADVEHGVLQKQFSWARLAMPIFLRALPLLLFPAAWGLLKFTSSDTSSDTHSGPYDGNQLWKMGVYLGIAIFWATWLQQASKRYPMHFLSHHVAALHLCYVDSHLPVSESREQAFTAVLGHSVCNIYKNDDFEINYIDESVRPPLSAELQHRFHTRVIASSGHVLQGNCKRPRLQYAEQV